MNPSLYVQIILTSWTKKSRGAPLATPRNAVPLALPLEKWQSNSASIWQLSYGESDEFKVPVVKRSKSKLTNEFQWGAFSLNWNGHQATTQFIPSFSTTGSPEIKSADPLIGHFAFGIEEWVRLRWQGRFSDYDTGLWWYEHTCINVACLSETSSPKIFFQKGPANSSICPKSDHGFCRMIMTIP